MHVNKTIDEWKIYRSSFLIRAKQLNDALVFVDALGHEHRGKKGDYLVEHFSGLQRIWPRQLFEDSHVALSPDESLAQAWTGTALTDAVVAAFAPKPARGTRKASGLWKSGGPIPHPSR